MKALTKLTIAALMITMMIQTATASNFNTFRMQITENLTVEVVTKVESLVEENLPVIHNMIRKTNPLYDTKLSLPVKAEELVNEDIATMPVASNNSSDLNLAAVVSGIRVPEKEVDDLTFDTKKVFDSYQSEHGFELTAKEVSKLAKEEQEVTEDESFYALMNSIAK